MQTSSSIEVYITTLLCVETHVYPDPFCLLLLLTVPTTFSTQPCPPPALWGPLHLLPSKFTSLIFKSSIIYLPHFSFSSFVCLGAGCPADGRQSIQGKLSCQGRQTLKAAQAKFDARGDKHTWLVTSVAATEVILRGCQCPVHWRQTWTIQAQAKSDARGGKLSRLARQSVMPGEANSCGWWQVLHPQR